MKHTWCVLGTVALAVGAFFIVPKIIKKSADLIYRPSKPQTVIDDEDWGPKIVKKEKKEVKEDGTEESDSL